jgi:Fur family zinc uptake transcriptional regulator
MRPNKPAPILKAAVDYCAQQGIRLTDARRFVLEIIGDAHKPIVAYDILAQLYKKMPNPKPPTAYRAIEFLREHHFIHRIESLNAYVACTAGHRHAGSQFMICDDCGNVTEAHLCDMPTPLTDKATLNGFHMNSWSMEIHGVCKSCTSEHRPQYACHSVDHL